MFKIINKNTAKKLTIDFCPTVKNLISYYGKDYPNWLEIPFELWDKNIEVIDDKIVEKSVDIQELKQKAIEYLIKRIEENKSFKFIQKINIADGRTINILTDLLESTLNSWVLLKNKAVKEFKLPDNTEINVRYTSIINEDTKKADFVPITDEEINRLQLVLTNFIDKLEQLKVDINNMIVSASDEEVISFYNKTEEEKQLYIKDIIEKNTNK